MSEADVWHRRGIVAFERGSFDAALDALAQAVALDDTRADIHSDLAVIAHSLGARARSETHFVRALALTPDVPRLRYNYANLLKDMGRFEEAAAEYERSIAGEPSFALARNNLGNVLKELKRWDEAAAAYRGAIAADAEFAPAHRNLADIDEMKNRTADAIAGFTHAATLRKDAGARIRAALAMPVIPQSVGEIDDTRARIVAGIFDLHDAGLRFDDPLHLVGATPFNLAYHGRDDRPIMELLASLYRSSCPSLTYTAPHCFARRRHGDPIRIGFVSSFLRDHTIARLNEALIAGLPRDRFEILVFDRLPRDLAAARSILAEAELDILYYTDLGMEPLTYFLAFARLAPVQCATWGHPVTSGIATIDFFISGDMIEPHGAQNVYTERVIELKAMPHVTTPGIDGIEKNGSTFLCPQSLFKFHPDFDAIIARILMECPNAGLDVLAGQHREWEAALMARWRKSIPQVVDRIRFVPRRGREDFAALLASARVVLDTPHFCGGLTSLETLAVGTPVVTLPGDFVRSRLTLGLYTIMGMDDLMAGDGAAYAELAVRLAKDETFHNDTCERVRTLSPRIVQNPKTIDEHAHFFEAALHGSV